MERTIRKVRLFGALTASAGLAMIGAGIAPATASVKDPGTITASFTATLVTSDPATPDIDFTGSAAGTVDSNGALSFPAAGMTISAANLTVGTALINVQPEATGPFTGSIDPATGVVSLSGPLQAKLTNADLGLANCPVGPFTLDMSTGNAGGVAYDKNTGTATITDPAYHLDPIPAGTAGCNPLLIPIINGPTPGLGDADGLPRDDAGPLVMTFTFSPALVEEDPLPPPPPPAPPGAPNTVNDVRTTPKDTPVTVDVLANDVQADADTPIDPSTLSIKANPTDGSAVVVDDKVVYTPNAGFTGRDTFQYEICSVDKAVPTTTTTIEQQEEVDIPFAVAEDVEILQGACHFAFVTVDVEAPAVAPVTVAPTTAAPATTVAVVAAAAAELPRTGGTSGLLALIGLSLVLGGVMLARSMRSRTEREPTAG